MSLFDSVDSSLLANCLLVGFALSLLQRPDLHKLSWGGWGSNPRPKDYESVTRRPALCGSRLTERDSSASHGSSYCPILPIPGWSGSRAIAAALSVASVRVASRVQQRKVDPMSNGEHAEAIQALAAERYAFEVRQAAGLVTPAEAKEHEAHEAEEMDRLDAARGTTATTYLEFRVAFERGAGCAELFELRSGMSPKDPLQGAVNEDLRSVRCFSSRSERVGGGRGADA